jgi:phospholipid/cholesterol/gamma-HCH transport system substrate-binding protein
MTSKETRDLTVGVFVLIGLGSLAYLSFSVGGVNYFGNGGLKLYATFDQIADLKPRARVEIAGVTVGEVKEVSLTKDFRARVELDVDDRLELPADTSAAILTAGLLGDRYVSLAVGADEQTLKSGDQIAYTDSAMVLERVIGKFLYNLSSDTKGGS